MPELQRVAIGDLLPAVPGALDAFIVEYVEPPRDLVLHGPRVATGAERAGSFSSCPRSADRAWSSGRLGALALQTERAEAGQHASFVVRLHGALLRLPVTILRPIGALGHRVMQARQLRRLKRRVEQRPVQGWCLRRDATMHERARAMPGDELVERPVFESTRAITVGARPSEIWPWLAQMGKGRGGLYSIDWLDRLFGLLDAPSADQVLPRWQGIRPGDAIPVGRTAWPVHSVDPERSLVLLIEDGDVLVTQSWGLYPVDPETTRLVLRVRGALPIRASNRVRVALLAPQELVMVRAQLRGIRRRAESLARARRTATGPVP